jgi:CBS domain-containing protein
MPMLSELLRYTVVDREGRTARLADLSYVALGQDYPRVTKLYYCEDVESQAIPWTAVYEIDHRSREIRVSDFSSPENGTAEDEGVDVLLRRDVEDALVLDLLNRTTARATDIMLIADDGHLAVKAVDVGFKAMLRRLLRGLYRGVNAGTLFDWKYVEYLRGDPAAAESGAGYRMRVGRLTAGEIAQLTEYIPYLHAAELLTLLPNDKAADVLEAMSLERQIQVIGEYDEDDATELLRRMSPDLAADLFSRLDISYVRRQLQRLPDQHSERIIELLQYPEDSVGGVMINDMICAERDRLVGDLREQLPSMIADRGFIATIFIINDEDEKKLVGTLSLRRLLRSPEDSKLEDVMYPFVQTLDAFTSAREGAWKIISTQLSALPVVDLDGRLLGAMTIDAAKSHLLSGEMSRVRIFS